MSKKIRIFITALLAALCLALCMCCFTACGEDKDERIAELEAENEELATRLDKIEGDLEELTAKDKGSHEFSVLLENLHSFYSIDWEMPHADDGLIIWIKDEYADMELMADALYPLKVKKVESLMNDMYYITLEEAGDDELKAAALCLYSKDFIAEVNLSVMDAADVAV